MVINLSERDTEFQVARALAIESYAQLETQICFLFGSLLETTDDKASAVFFRITNARSRNEMLEELLRKTHPTFMPFLARTTRKNGKARTAAAGEKGGRVKAACWS
jgi:hypothetical protein